MHILAYGDTALILSRWLKEQYLHFQVLCNIFAADRSWKVFSTIRTHLELRAKDKLKADSRVCTLNNALPPCLPRLPPWKNTALITRKRQPQREQTGRPANRSPNLCARETIDQKPCSKRTSERKAVHAPLHFFHLFRNRTNLSSVRLGALELYSYLRS